MLKKKKKKFVPREREKKKQLKEPPTPQKTQCQKDSFSLDADITLTKFTVAMFLVLKSDD